MQKIETQGVAIPRLGFGTFRMPGGGCQPIVESALGMGYRHVDTAAMYENEEAVGAAIAATGVKRNELFVTTKVWHDQLGRGAVRKSFDTSLSKLKLDYVDLFMVHWPSADMDLPAVLEEMVAIKAEGKTKAIGVCNFNMEMMRQAIDEIQAPIAALQIEFHPFLDQSKMLEYVRGKNIPLTAYAPLAQGRAAQDGILQAIGKKHGASGAQVAIAWLLDQHGVIAIPKARSETNQRSNLEASKIQLDDTDRAMIAALPKDQRYVTPPFAPVWNT
jgi:2,5-diketo-D-gluconate reductase B